MEYRYKVVQEVLWAIFIAVLVSVFTALVTFDAATITDWRVWGTGIFSGCVRAISAAVLPIVTGKVIFQKS